LWIQERLEILFRFMPSTDRNGRPDHVPDHFVEGAAFQKYFDTVIAVVFIDQGDIVNGFNSAHDPTSLFLSLLDRTGKTNGITSAMDALENRGYKFRVQSFGASSISMIPMLRPGRSTVAPTPDELEVVSSGVSRRIIIDMDYAVDA
jgi:hypothetical protein